MVRLAGLERTGRHAKHRLGLMNLRGPGLLNLASCLICEWQPETESLFFDFRAQIWSVRPCRGSTSQRPTHVTLQQCPSGAAWRDGCSGRGRRTGGGCSVVAPVFGQRIIAFPIPMSATHRSQCVLG